MWHTIASVVAVVAAVGLTCVGGGLWLNTELSPTRGRGSESMNSILSVLSGLLLCLAYLAVIVSLPLCMRYLRRRVLLVIRLHEMALHLVQGFNVLNAIVWLLQLLAASNQRDGSDNALVERRSYWDTMIAASVCGFAGSLLLLCVNTAVTFQARRLATTAADSSSICDKEGGMRSTYSTL